MASPQILNLVVGPDHAVPVNPGGGTVTVSVDQTGGTVYYADNSQVSAQNNQGSLSPGGSAVLTAPAWLIASSAAGVSLMIADVWEQWGQVGPTLFGSALPTVIHSFGHSYIGGAMSNASSNRQTAKLAGACSGTETNKGVGSSILCTHNSVAGTVDTNTAPAGIVGVLQNVTAARTPGTDPFLTTIQCAVLCWGINDWAVMGSAQFAISFPANLHTAIRRIRAGAIFEDPDASVTYTSGTWSLGSGTTGNSGAGNHSCTGTTGVITIAVPSQYQGQAITIGGVDVGNAYTMTCVDEKGINRGSITFGNYSFTQSQRRNGYPSIYIPAGTLSAGSHTLTLNYAQAGSNPMFFDYWSIESAPSPLILVQLANRMTYANHASGWPNAPLNDNAITSMNATMQTVASSYSDGRVVCIPTDDIINNNPAMMTSDQVHPNSNAAGLIAGRFWRAVLAANAGRSDLLQLGTT